MKNHKNKPVANVLQCTATIAMTLFSLRHLDRDNPGILDIILLCLLPVYVVITILSVGELLRNFLVQDLKACNIHAIEESHESAIIEK